MFHNAVTMRQLAVWLSAALIPTLLQLSAGAGWMAAAITAAVCSCIAYAVTKWGRYPCGPVFALLQYLYIIVLLCNLLPYAAYSWPGDNYPAVPLILLLLAAWSAHKSAQAAARVSCVLFWLVLGIYLIVLALGTGEVRVDWLRPAQAAPPWQGGTLLLISSGATLAIGKQQKWNFSMLLPAGFYILGTVVVSGVLSSERAYELPDPLYTTVRSLMLPGIAQRFEALLSASMTVGWFSLLTVLLTMSAGAIEAAKPAWGKKALWVATACAGAGMLCNLHISWWILAVLATVFWAIIPLLTQGLVRAKKM